MSIFRKAKRIAELEMRLEADPLVQVDFPLVVGDRLSSLHAYSVYSALKSREPWLEQNPTVLINSIAGKKLYDKQIETHCNSKLQLRVPISFASRLYALAGVRLSVGQGSICLQAPTIKPIDQKQSLYSRIVTINLRDLKDALLPPELFLAAAQRQFGNLDIRGKLSLVLERDEPKRGVVKVKKNFIPGYAVEVKDLDGVSSLKLQQFGLGGKQKMGCGWFE